MSTAVALRREENLPARPGDIHAVIPANIEEAVTLAAMICKAKLAPDSYDTAGHPDPQKVTIGILKSLEVGLPPITGLSTIAIINKRPCIWGDGAVALVQSRGVVEKIEVLWEGAEAALGPTDTDGTKDFTPTIRDFADDVAAVYRIWRKGQETPYEGRFSVRDAKRAHLWGKKQPWIQYPKRMLIARARAYALRDGFADCLSGLSIREEVEDLPAEAPEQADVSFLSDDPPAQIAAPTDQPIGEVQVSPGASAPEPASLATEGVQRPSMAAGDAGAPAPQDETAPAPGEPANGDDGSTIPPPTILAIEPDADEQAVLAWCKVAAEILSVAPTPKWIDGWLAANGSTLNRIKTAGPKGVRYYKRLVDRASERAGELRAAA